MPAHLSTRARHTVTAALTAATAVTTVAAAPSAHALPTGNFARAEHRVARAALTHVGQRYREGAAGPRAFDCSGLALYLYRHVGVHLPRTANRQYHATRRISRTHARPGDLIFYHSGSYVFHVAVYEGRGMQVAAATPADGVVHQHVWSRSVTFGRPRG
jgi:cell wall-associated NlpC family hydrolase